VHGISRIINRESPASFSRLRRLGGQTQDASFQGLMHEAIKRDRESYLEDDTIGGNE
jgi:hypothetical protein